MTRTEHLLAIISEECGEVSQRAIKAMRFGLTEVQPHQPDTNAKRIMREFADLVGVIEMLQAEGALPDVERVDVDQKKNRVEKYLRLSAKCGTLDPSECTPPEPSADSSSLAPERIARIIRAARELVDALAYTALSGAPERVDAVQRAETALIAVLP